MSKVTKIFRFFRDGLIGGAITGLTAGLAVVAGVFGSYPSPALPLIAFGAVASVYMICWLASNLVVETLVWAIQTIGGPYG
jgi:hypothetical protein